MSQGKKLDALLMIEGRSIPFAGATCTYRTGQPAVANIEMVPLREINDILPRTMVHIFVKDFNHTSKNKPWILLFEGEVYGYAMGKSANSRSTTLMCMGLSNYWDNAKQSYMNVQTSTDTTGNMLNSAVTQESATSNQAAYKEGTGSLSAYLVNVIKTKLNAKGDPEKFLEAILDVISAIRNVNSFFRYNEARYRISDRIGFFPSGKISEILDFTNKEQYLESIAGGGNGGTRTIRQILNYLMGLTFHHFVSVPCPSKIAAPDTVQDKIGPKQDKTIGSFLFKPDSFMLPPPRCNVIYPDQYNQFQYTRNFFHEISRLNFRPGPTVADTKLNINIPRKFQKAFIAPSGYSEYYNAKSDDNTQYSSVTDTVYSNPGISGSFGDKETGLTVSTILKDFHFMSYEEVLKGIFGDQGHMMQSAQLLSKVSSFGTQNKFYQRATDFMFFKKRFASRVAQLSGPLNLSPVPGFSILILDDSEAEQHVTGHLEGVTHSIRADGGGFTSYEVSFPRLVEEKDLWEGNVSEPPIPPWYDEAYFGQRRKVTADDYKNLPTSVQARVKNMGVVNDFGNSQLGKVYATLLGDSKRDGQSYLGSTPITTTKYPSITAATLEIMRRYRWAKSNGVTSEHINKYTRRDYVYLSEIFEFLGAELTTSQKNADYNNVKNIIFKGERFDGGYVDYDPDESERDKALKDLFGKEAIKRRRDPINKYRSKLLTERGFRG